MSCARHIAIPLILAAILFSAATAASASDYAWKDYREPLTTDVSVCHNNSAKITVDLPAVFLETQGEYVVLVVSVTSGARKLGENEHNFRWHNCFLKFNGQFFGSYRLPTKDTPKTQTIELRVKKKHLKVGKNQITASFAWKDSSWSCKKGSCCGYHIYNVHFKDAPVIRHSLAISSSPSEASIYVDGVLHGSTPATIDLKKGLHSVKIEKDGYRPADGLVDLVDGKSLSYALEPIDDIPPEIAIHSHRMDKGAVVVNNSTTTRIEGRVTDNSRVTSLTINGSGVGFDDEGYFSANLALVLGQNRVMITATDSHQNEASRELAIIRKGVLQTGSAGGAITGADSQHTTTQSSGKEGPAPTSAGMAPSSSTPVQRWAVIIGISSYEDTRIPSLRYAARDARTFYDWVVAPEGGKYAPANVRLLLDQEATLSNIKYSLFLFLKGALEEDVVTLFFAGHGSPDSPDTPDNLFLLPYDTKYDSIATTGFPMWDIETALKRYIKAKRVIVIADACHSGGVGKPFDIARRASRSVRVNAISSGIQNLSLVGDGVCILSASSNRQFSQEGKQWGGGHGVFTHFLLQGLAGDADYNRDTFVNLGELTSYVSEKVRRETLNAQSPTVAGRYDPALTIGK